MAAGFLPRDVLLAFFRARVQGPLDIIIQEAQPKVASVVRQSQFQYIQEEGKLHYDNVSILNTFFTHSYSQYF